MSNDNRFVQVYRNPDLRKRFYPFLENVLRLYPANDLDALIRETVNIHESKEGVYKDIQATLPGTQSGFTRARSAVSALNFQREVMFEQTMELLSGRYDRIDTYAEIGTKGRYVRLLHEELGFQKCYLVTDPKPGFSPTDFLERLSLSRPWQWTPLGNSYTGLGVIKYKSVDLISIYIGLHHAPKEYLNMVLAMANLILRPGGHIIIREHDCTSPEVELMAGLAHDVFDVATGVSWGENSRDVQNFHSIDEWESMFAKHGFRRMHRGLLQTGDPSMNTLVIFKKL